MLFNSIEFAIFLPIVFVLYWFVVNKNLKLQNLLIVVASYIFYGWWDWRFLLLIFLSCIVDYLVGNALSKQEDKIKRKFLLSISITLNLGLLGFFKYFNFFIDSFADAFTLFGQSINPTTLNIILPVGISFYTFQALSYSIDVYRRKLEPTKDLIVFLAFVSFFPQLVAGPIERATNLLSQFYVKRNFDYTQAADGMRQILWGLFKKKVIADNCSIYANDIFTNYHDYSGFTLVIGAIFFAFQIYCDFSGYSDIAIGTARLFGFKLMQNFAFPYFSRDIAEFWRRWHISLSTWFRDYLYIPLGGSKGGTLMKIRNTFVIFVVSGFWHGANWTFVIWGTLNALYFLPLLLLNKNRNNTDIAAANKILPSIKEVFQIVTTFSLTLVAWIFFRAENVNHAFGYLKQIFTNFFQSYNLNLPNTSTVFFILVLILIEWLQRNKLHALQISDDSSKILRRVSYFLIVIAIYLFGGQQQSFIYFQF